MTRGLDDIFPLNAGTVNLTASAVSNRVALPGGDQTLRVVNNGALGIYLNGGNASVLASVGNMFLAGGASGLFSRDPNTMTHIAGIASSSIITLNIAMGEGKYN